MGTWNAHCNCFLIHPLPPSLNARTQCHRAITQTWWRLARLFDDATMKSLFSIQG